MPIRHSSRMIQRAESDASVKPISTCSAPAVTRGSARPASAAAALAISNAPVSPAMPAAARRSLTATVSSPARACGGSVHSGSAIRSIRRRFSRSDAIRALTPRAVRRSTVSSAARDKATSSSQVALRRLTSCGPSRSTRNTSEPRLSASTRPARLPGRASSSPSTVSTSASLRIASSIPASHASSTRRRSRVAAAGRSGAAIPSQSNTIASKRRASAAAIGGSALGALMKEPASGWARLQVCAAC